MRFLILDEAFSFEVAVKHPQAVDGAPEYNCWNDNPASLLDLLVGKCALKSDIKAEVIVTVAAVNFLGSKHVSGRAVGVCLLPVASTDAYQG